MNKTDNPLCTKRTQTIQVLCTEHTQTLCTKRTQTIQVLCTEHTQTLCTKRTRINIQYKYHGGGLLKTHDRC